MSESAGGLIAVGVDGSPARVIFNQCADADLLVLGGHHADPPLRQTVGAANER